MPLRVILGMLALIAVCSCTGHSNVTCAKSKEPSRQPEAVTVGTAGGTGGAAVSATAPKAMAYRMSGDYADNVPVTLAPDGAIISYPAPTDLSDRSAPIPLADGWWLDRRGISVNSVFTRYTYNEYRALKVAPTPAELKTAIIPHARVTTTLQLPMSLAEATADTGAVNAAIRRLVPLFRSRGGATP